MHADGLSSISVMKHCCVWDVIDQGIKFILLLVDCSVDKQLIISIISLSQFLFRFRFGSFRIPGNLTHSTLHISNIYRCILYINNKVSSTSGNKNTPYLSLYIPSIDNSLIKKENKRGLAIQPCFRPTGQ